MSQTETYVMAQYRRQLTQEQEKNSMPPYPAPHRKAHVQKDQRLQASSSASLAATTGSYREVGTMAAPVVLTMFSQTLMWLVDTSLLGRFGTIEQGAAGLAGSLLWPFLTLFNCSGAGVNIMVAQASGARRYEQCGTAPLQGLYLSIVAWLFMLVAGLCATPLVRLVGPSPELLEPTSIYLRIRLLGSLPGLCNFSLLGFFRGRGDTKTPLKITILVNMLNICLDYLLIFGHAGLPRLGIAGAALGTVLATTTGTCLYLHFFLRQARQAGMLPASLFFWDRALCWKILRLSWPVGVQGALDTGAWTCFTTFVAHLGALEAAAHHIAVQVLSLSYMAGYGVSIATTTLVGQYLGARNVPAAQQSMQRCLIVGLSLMGALGIGFVGWRSVILQLFTHDTAVQVLGAQLLIWVAGMQLFDGFILIATGVLRGAGDTRWPMLAGALINWLVFVPCAYLAIFAYQHGPAGGWIVAVLAMGLLSVILGRRLWQGQWQHRPLVMAF